MITRIFTVAILAVFTIFSFNCGDGGVNPPVTQTGKLRLSVTRLKSLDTNSVYEGWIVVNGAPVSTGTFSVNSSGGLSRDTFNVNASQLSNATAFLITVEQTSGPSTPSNTKILAGSFSGTTANLTTSDPLAMGISLSSFSGQYLLATPTTGETDDSLKGIWFMKPDNTAGLQMPIPNTGWVYEGWVIINNIPVSTGKFVNVNQADSTRPYSGNLPGPNFPGEDFYRNPPPGVNTFPATLRNLITFISIEPSVDNSIAPFYLQPLQHYIPVDAISMTNYTFDNVAALITPVGTATR